jgi:cytidyltransferase-like protein
METVDEAVLLAGQARSVGLIIGYTSGVFDLFHEGHSTFLTRCGASCHILCVAVDGDALVRRRKGPCRPHQDECTRVNRVRSLANVGAAFIKTGSSEPILKSLRPDRLFVASDKELSRRRCGKLRAWGIEVVEFAYTEGISTTQLISR